MVNNPVLFSFRFVYMQCSESQFDKTNQLLLGRGRDGYDDVWTGHIS